MQIGDVKRALINRFEDAINSYGSPGDFDLVLGDPLLLNRIHTLISTSAKSSVVKPWLKVVLGKFKNGSEVTGALIRSNTYYGDFSSWVRDDMGYYQNEFELPLYRATVAEIGLPEGGSWDQIRGALYKAGGANCPPETAFAMMEHHNCFDCRMIVVTEPVKTHARTYNHFVVFGNGVNAKVDEGHVSGDEVLVFCKKDYK